MRLDPGDQVGNAEAAMKVATIIQSKGDRVVTTRPDSKLGAVVARLKAEGIGAMVVSEDGVKIAGLVSERDIVHALALRSAIPIPSSETRTVPSGAKPVKFVTISVRMRCRPGTVIRLTG